MEAKHCKNAQTCGLLCGLSGVGSFMVLRSLVIVFHIPIVAFMTGFSLLGELTLKEESQFSLSRVKYDHHFPRYI